MSWEQRWHPLREEWVVLAAHRNDRPWIGKTIDEEAERPPAYAEGCTFCPGNARVSGVRNPEYEGVFVFDNDHPCVGERAPRTLEPTVGIYRNRAASGLARVVCYSPRHDLTLADLETREVENLLATWQEQYRDLGERPEVNHVLVFENKGKEVGVSNPHPHGQIYATNFVFKTIEVEARACREHRRETGRGLLEDVIDAEVRDGRRILCDHGSALSFVPYFARWAYETFVTPKAPHASIADLSNAERADLAHVLRDTVRRYDALWKQPFPYVLALHQAPTDGAHHEGFHFHLEFHPPLRKPTLLKHLAGPEVGGGNFLSDTSPEEKAAELRSLEVDRGEG